MANNRHRPGFTLLELLVVISIIAVLVTMLAPSLRMVTVEAGLTGCKGNMRTLYQAFLQYEDMTDVLPHLCHWQEDTSNGALATVRNGDKMYWGALLAK